MWGCVADTQCHVISCRLTNYNHKSVATVTPNKLGILFYFFFNIYQKIWNWKRVRKKGHKCYHCIEMCNDVPNVWCWPLEFFSIIIYFNFNFFENVTQRRTDLKNKYSDKWKMVRRQIDFSMAGGEAEFNVWCVFWEMNMNTRSTNLLSILKTKWNHF